MQLSKYLLAQFLALGLLQLTPMVGALAVNADMKLAARSAATSTVSCVGVSPWETGVAYVGGDQVTYNDDLWSAKWWSYNDIPGGAAGVWVDEGMCMWT